MSLSDKLRISVIEDLEQININMIGIYARKNEEALNYLYNNGIIDDSSIENALEKAVFMQAIDDYNVVTQKRRGYSVFADYVERPECFAYALNNNWFSKEKINKINFDQGYTAELFSRDYGRENLLSILREELLNPKPLLGNLKEDSDLC